ncbi:hypothetical protein N7478_012598 [Penicillium angulare]|uniref:uncharacterized protein n=1 Tax=Penicillium angulare TaxID=116970 RepID=UPI00254255F8|nr:uncharacterized protein N7478_012598 [Penicillium angulare]KAJ5259617.1 hypothetical protein N7478_012598 [Penicillium angulare]
MGLHGSNLYNYYVPSLPAAIVFAALFVVLTALHTWKIISTRQWFGIAIFVGGLFEIIALVTRAYTHSNTGQLVPYIIQYVLVLLAPILFTASVYMFLGRVIRVSGQAQLSLIRINWITKIFVVGDILCFLVQAFGGVSLANLANSNDSDVGTKTNRAKDVILAGLALQVIFFLIFSLCAVVFHVRVSKPGIRESIDPSLRLNTLLVSIYITAFLITGRNIYRLVEYKSGTGGYLQEHEWPTYGLDVGFMTIFMIITFFWYYADTKARLAGKYGCLNPEEKLWSDSFQNEFPLDQGYGNTRKEAAENNFDPRRPWARV